VNFELMQRCQIADKREVLKSVIITLKGVFLFQNIQTVCGAHPPSCSMCNSTLPLGINRPGREVDL